MCKHPKVNAVRWLNQTDPGTGEWGLTVQGLQSDEWARTCPVSFVKCLCVCNYQATEQEVYQKGLHSVSVCHHHLKLTGTQTHERAQGPSEEFPFGLFCTPYGNPGALGFGNKRAGYNSYDNVLLAFLSIFQYVSCS